MLYTGYEKWNTILFDHFFGNHKSQTVVYLYVNEELIVNLGTKMAIPQENSLNDFCLSVQSYIRNVDELFERVTIRGQRWFSQKAGGIPPFIAILALTVLAAVNMRADTENGIGGGNYYIRLCELLNLGGTGRPKGFDKFQILWEILRDWQEENNGRFGFINIFEFGTRYTAYARSQCLIREAEREQLYEFFYWTGYKPGSEISLSNVIDHLEVYLSSRINRMSRMFNTRDVAVKKAIAETVLHEYKRWNGVVSNKQSELNDYSRNEVNKVKQFNLFLVLEAEGIMPTSKLSFNYLVEDESYFNSAEDDDFWFEGFTYNNNLLRRYVGEEVLTRTIDFESTGTNFRLSHKGSDYFIFRKGHDLGFKGWVSRKEFLQSHEHLLLFCEEKDQIITQWIIDQNITSKNKNYRGLPLGWKCLSVVIPENSVISPFDDNISISNENISIRFTGGLKIGNQEWLLDAPPTISLSSPPKSIFSIDDIDAFCLIEGVDSIDLSLLQLRSSKAYDFKVNNMSKTIILRNDHIHHIDSKSFTPVTTQASEGDLRIAGTYIYNKLDEINNYFEITNGVAVFSFDGRRDKKRIPPFINGAPYDLNRGYNTLGINFRHDTIPLRKIDLFIEYLTLREEGNWNNFLRGVSWCFGEEKLRLKAYEVRQKLSQTGFVEFTREGNTNNYYWRVIPTSAAVIPCADPIVSITGARTRKIIETWSNNKNESFEILWAVPSSELEPLVVYLHSEGWEYLTNALQGLNIPYNLGEDYFAYHLANCLPSLTSQINNTNLITSDHYESWQVKCWDTALSKWVENGSSRLKQYTSRYGEYICILQLRNGKKVVERDVGKLYLAATENRKLFKYRNHELRVRSEYTLPELYERALVSCVGQCPEKDGSYRVYKNVPLEVAWTIVHKLGYDLEFLR